MGNNDLPQIIDIPDDEKKEFEKLIKSKRSDHFRASQTIVEDVLEESTHYQKLIDNKNISKFISELREAVWQEFLKEEIEFNALLMKDLHKSLKTPSSILDNLITNNIANKTGVDLEESVRSICGEYSGRIFPYIYKLALSNTQSRRSRAGRTFETIVYKIYETLKYPFDSQSKVGRKTFEKLGLGKKVDSILPSANSYTERRNKTIIGTMKTTLRERWQEVAEEIERTKIPEIHLLTVDTDISKSKAQEMANHNIIVVAYKLYIPLQTMPAISAVLCH